MPKSSLTNDDLRNDILSGLVEAKRRLETHGLNGQARRVKLAMALLCDVEGEVHAGGELAARSAPEDKD